MITLTEEQKKHYESIKWLISGPLATGRTTLLAWAFIEHAIDHPEEKIRIFDHYHNFMTDRYMMHAIQIYTQQSKDFKFIMLDYSFKYTGKRYKKGKHPLLKEKK
jgi:hypothetical protein